MLFTFKDYTKINNDILNLVKNKTSDNNIIAWCNKIMKFLSQSQDQILHNYLDANFNISAYFRAEIEHIIDYLENIDEREKIKQLKGNYIQVNNNAKKWTISTQKRIKQKQIKDEEGLKNIMMFDDGYRWVQLTTKENCKREGKEMGHCVGGYDPNIKTILSLRDPKNYPHVTIEIIENNIKQIKGKANTAPDMVYRSYIYQLLEKFPRLIVKGDGDKIGMMEYQGAFYIPNTSKWIRIYNDIIIPLQIKKFEELKNRIYETN
jgi:hypothetical protein